VSPWQGEMDKSLDMNSISIQEKKSSSSSKKSSSSSSKDSQGSAKATTTHWSTTKDGILIAKLTSFIYRKIITSGDEGGLKVSSFYLSLESFSLSLPHLLSSCSLIEFYGRQLSSFSKLFS
jgi:hypothetical protein